MFFEAVTITASGILQTFVLGFIGYMLIRRNLLGEEALNALSRLVIEVTLPLLIFCRLIKEFDFQQYPYWWVLPLISIAITCTGMFVGWIFVMLRKHKPSPAQFISLVAFQNSGYLPLAFIDSLLPAQQAHTMFIYIFLFLLGFNLLMFSLGTHMLVFAKEKRFHWWSLLSPPVIATLAGLALVMFKLQSIVPAIVFKPLAMVGDTTVALATLVVGGNLAALRCQKTDAKSISLMILAKLILMPLAGLWLVYQFHLPQLIGLLIVVQLAMPPATNLSVILSTYKQKDCLVSQGIFYASLASIITIPLFLSLYFMGNMVK